MKRLKILIRSLLKSKTTSAITIVGFSISISMALIMIAFLIKEYSYDKTYPNIERIYRILANENNASVREDFREYFLDNYPEIEDACRYNNDYSTVTFENTPFRGQMISTDPSFFKIFSIQFIIGSGQSSLNGMNDVVITESFARKVFGNENPVGKSLVAEYKEALVVTGVIKDFSEYSSIQGDFITNSKLKIWYERHDDGQGNKVDYFRLYVMLKNRSVNTSSIEAMLTKDISAIKYEVGYPIKTINLIPFEESYFMQGINRSQTNHANIRLIRLLSLITSIIILLAVFNYINLSTATHSTRFQEIGIKKTIGAGRWQIFSQFIIESFAVCFLSFLFALLLSNLWVPTFERFLASNIHMDILFQPVYLGWLILGIIFISLLSGIYPALSISKLKPISIFRKREVVKQGSLGFRAVLNILQYVVSVALIIAVIVLSRQIDYVRTKDFGFDTDKLLRVNVHWRLADKVDVIRDKLLTSPFIKNVSFSHGSPGGTRSSSSWDALGEDNMEIKELTVDSAFFKVFQIPIVQGRNLLPSDFNKVCYLNETAYKKIGWDSFEGKKFQGLEIIGIVKDFNFASLYNPITPLAIPVSSGMGISHLTLTWIFTVTNHT